MGATLQALGGILLRAIPTFLLVILLNYYLKFAFFRPLERILQKRFEITEGARKLAENAMERASAKTAEYEAAIRAARAEVYEAQEGLHRQLEERHAAEMAAARERAEAAIQRAKDDLMKDMEVAKVALATEAESLSERVAQSFLVRSAA